MASPGPATKKPEAAPEAGAAKGLDLKTRYLWIALLPVLGYIGLAELLHLFGDATDDLPRYFSTFDAHGEAAARLTALGTLVLVVGVAIGALAYFASTVRLLARRSIIEVLAAFLVLVLVGFAVVATMRTRQMQDYMGPKLVCAALGYSPQLSTSGADAASANSVQPKVRTVDERGEGGCENRRYGQLRWLLLIQRYATLLGVSAVVLGSICCLGALSGPKDDKARLDHYQEQSGRLNIYLYLSALFLVVGLFFASAYAHWPSYALLTHASYDAHANAFAAYLGFSYSLLIASFYAPVAALLTVKVKELKRKVEPSAANGTESQLPEAFKGPLQIVKIVAAIFSTALAGVLPALLGLGG